MPPVSFHNVGVKGIRKKREVNINDNNSVPENQHVYFGGGGGGGGGGGKIVPVLSIFLVGAALLIFVLIAKSSPSAPAADLMANNNVRGRNNDALVVMVNNDDETATTSTSKTKLSPPLPPLAITACAPCQCTPCEKISPPPLNSRVYLSLHGGGAEPLSTYTPSLPPGLTTDEIAECTGYLTAGATGERNGVDGTFTNFLSQFGQDAYIYRNFFLGRAMGDGFYLDVGANAPKELSNTWFFDKCLGWKGICVEASPTRSQQLREERSCKVIENCVWSKEKTLHLSGTDSNSINDHLTTGGHPVLCRTIDDILTKEGVTGTIDFFSLDIESSEPQGLRGMDFKRFKPDVVTIETFWLNQTIHNSMFDFGELGGPAPLAVYVRPPPPSPPSNPRRYDRV